MIIFGKEFVEEYLSRHSNLRTSYLKWIDTIEAATFKNHNELKAVFPKADYVGNERYVFDLKGNHYRLIVVAVFVNDMMFIRWVGTHAEYDKIKDCSVI